MENYGGGSLPTLAYGATKQHKANCGNIVAYELRHCAGRGTVTLPGAARERIRRRRSARRARKFVAEK